MTGDDMGADRAGAGRGRQGLSVTALTTMGCAAACCIVLLTVAAPPAPQALPALSAEAGKPAAPAPAPALPPGAAGGGVSNAKPDAPKVPAKPDAPVSSPVAKPVAKFVVPKTPAEQGDGTITAPTAAGSVLPRFRHQVVDADAGVGYAVAVTDINGDGKPDIVAVTEQPDRVVWYENPGWQRHVIVEKEPRLPVCIQPFDVDGDGKVELILGADWVPSNTTTGGTVWLLHRGDPADPRKGWKAVKLDEEPNMHRMRLVTVDGKPELLCSPLQGRGTKGPDWGLGNKGTGPVQYLLRRPADPFKDKWTREVVTADLHTIHNVWPVDFDGSGKPQLLFASFEGVFHTVRAAEGKWLTRQLGTGDQVARPNRGSSEIKIGRLPGGKRYLATTEPWHGHQAVVYTEPADPAALWTRNVLVADHKGGHAVWTADFTGTGTDSLVVGFRGPPEGKAGEWVLYLFHPVDAAAGKWETMVVDNKGMGCEDCAAADFDGDGKVDLVGVGRGTKNVKVYWNLGAARP